MLVGIPDLGYFLGRPSDLPGLRACVRLRVGSEGADRVTDSTCRVRNVNFRGGSRSSTGTGAREWLVFLERPVAGDPGVPSCPARIPLEIMPSILPYSRTILRLADLGRAISIP